MIRDDRVTVFLSPRRGHAASGFRGAGRGTQSAASHPVRARWTRRRCVAPIINSALADAHTGSNERTNKRTNESKHGRSEGRTDGHVIASRRIGWRRVCSCSFHCRPCREDGGEAALIRARRSRVRAGMPVFSLSFLAVLFLSNYRRGQRPIDESRASRRACRRRCAVNVARRTTTRSLVAARRARGARSCSGDLRRRGHLVARLSRRGRERAPASATAPAEMRRADWRSRPRPM